MLLAPMAAPPKSASEELPLTLGLATTFHCVPFQCSTSVRPPWPLPYAPTDQTFWMEMAATPLRKLVLVPTFGLGTLLQTPQEWRVCCGIATNASADPCSKRAASATTVMQGRTTILRRFIKFSPVVYCFHGSIPF